MKKLTPFSALIASIALGSSALAQQPEGFAVANTSGIPVQMSYGDHTQGSNLNTPTSLDIYTFQGMTDETATFALRGQALDLDPHVTILDPMGGELAPPLIANALSHQRTSVSGTYTLMLDGLYTILVRDNGNNNTGAYIAQLERTPPVVPPRPLVSGVSIIENLGHETDMDYLSIQLAKGTITSVSVTSLSLDLDPIMEVYDPNGDVFSPSDSCTALSHQKCSFNFKIDTLNEPNALAGEYLLRLRDAGWDNTGNVSITATCFFGPCADTYSGLSVDVANVSASAGGIQSLSLDAGSAHAGEVYFVLGTTTGISPGFDVDGYHMPLNIDGLSGYFMYTLRYPNSVPLGSSLGFLDGDGKASAACGIPPGLDPSFVGTTLSHCFVTIDMMGPFPELTYVSNPVALSILP